MYTGLLLYMTSYTTSVYYDDNYDDMQLISLIPSLGKSGNQTTSKLTDKLICTEYSVLITYKNDYLNQDEPAGQVFKTMLRMLLNICKINIIIL